jgi:hypothetical protein
MTDSNKPSQKSLEDIEEIDKTLQELGKWLQKVRFEPAKMENSENCADSATPAAAKRLLGALGLEVPSLNRLVVQSS